MERQGLFIALEGIDGCGKTANSQELCEWLNELGYEAFTTHEPTDMAAGNLAKSHLIMRDVSPHVESLLFAVDRLEHVSKVIFPALKQGKIVICDRYLYSSLGYQGSTGVEMEWLREINRFSISADLALFLDVDVREAMNRCDSKGLDLNKFEIDYEFRVRAREIFLGLSRAGELVKIDSGAEFKKVQEDIRNAVKPLLEERKATLSKSSQGTVRSE